MLTPEQLATAVGLTVEQYEHIERGNFPYSPSVFISLVEALQVPADQLLLELEPPELSVIHGGKSKTPSP